MSYRFIQLHLPKKHEQMFSEMVRDPLILDYWRLEEDRGRISFTLLTQTHDMQTVTDKLQTFLGTDEYKNAIGVDTKVEDVRIVVMPVEAVLPKPKQDELEFATGRRRGTISREELHDDIEKGARLDATFLWLALLSTVVAAIGLLENNLAVVIGAMVIAPFLGPNLALALSTSLGDIDLAVKSLKTNLAGVCVTLLFSILLGMYWPYGLDSPELLSRTEVGFDGIVLAIASGSAAVLSLLTGISSVLVGVMVAVALLPPATVLGIMWGAGQYDLAAGAALLLAVNIVCVNLSANIVFWLKGIRPRTWYEQKKAGTALAWCLVFWLVALAGLASAIYTLHNGG